MPIIRNKPPPPTSVLAGRPLKEKAVGTLLKIERTTTDGSVYVVTGEKIGLPTLAGYTDPIIKYLETQPGVEEFLNIGFLVYELKTYRRVSRANNAALIDGAKIWSHEQKTLVQSTYPWKAHVFITERNDHDSAMKDLYTMCQTVLKRQDDSNNAKSMKSWQTTCEREAKKGIRLVRSYPPFDNSVNNVSHNPFRPLDHVITDNGVAAILSAILGHDMPQDAPEGFNPNSNLYNELQLQEPGYIEGYFSRKGHVEEFSYSAIQGFGFPNGNISEKVKPKTEGFTTEELADIDKRATIAFKANNQKYNSEEDAKKQIMHEIQEYKKGQNKMKRQLTLDSYTIITTDGTELISQLTSPVASPLKKLKKNDVAYEDEVETVV